jgi:hypothetical protein
MLTTLQLVLLASLFIPMLTLMAIVRIWGAIRSIRRGHPPIADKLLRSPGESLRRELEKMDEEVNDIFVWTFFGPALATTVFVVTNSGAKPIAGATLPWIIFIGVLAIVFALLIWKLVYLINRRRSYRLGFTGERAVGEELNQLMLEGCHVFHDVPVEPYGNIDHVIVSPSGIFAVETKTVSKPRFQDGKTGYRVIFDGRLLRFPHRSDGSALGQAEHQAKRLANFLSQAIGERVSAEGILTLPGWMVERKARSNVKVLNPKEIEKIVLDKSSTSFTKELRNRVVYQLDQRCRDVEF